MISFKFRVLANYMMWEVIWKTYKYFPRAVSEEFTNSFAGGRTNQARDKICFQHVRDLLGLPLSMLIMDDFGSDKFKQVNLYWAAFKVLPTEENWGRSNPYYPPPLPTSIALP